MKIERMKTILKSMSFLLVLLIHSLNISAQNKSIEIIQDVNVRAEPNAHSKILQIAKKDEVYTTTTGSRDGWVAIERSGKTGFVNQKYTRVRVIKEKVDYLNFIWGLPILLLIPYFIYRQRKQKAEELRQERSRRESIAMFKNAMQYRTESTTKTESTVIIDKQKPKTPISTPINLNTKAYLSLLEDVANMQQQLYMDMQAFQPLVASMGGFIEDLDIDKLVVSINLDLARVLTIIEGKKGKLSNLQVLGLRYFLHNLMGKDDKNSVIEILKSANRDSLLNHPTLTVFERKSDFKLLPTLSILKYPNIDRYITFLHRAGLVMTKSDGKITLQEKENLQILFKELHAYANKKEDLINTDPNTKKITRKESLEELMGQLNSLIGLNSVKQEIADITSFVQIQKARQEQGLKTAPTSLHFVFTGNPGTGKTTVARLLSKILRELGVLSSGHLVEVDREGMIASYVGQTSIKVDEKVQEALDGTLFIDEAYSIVSNGANDFGNEAISAILKRMEDYRDRLSVIAAGYPKEMNDFINSNPGLKSRFTRFIHFPDYTARELFQIFLLFCKRQQYKLSKDAEHSLISIFEEVIKNKSANFGNARLARNVFSNTTENQAKRLSDLIVIDRQSLELLILTDLPSLSEIIEK